LLIKSYYKNKKAPAGVKPAGAFFLEGLMTKINGAEIIIRLLEKQNVKVVAGIPGGANLPIYDALAKSNIRHILARHEQGAGFIAHGIARSSRRAGVCLATSGPGITNLVTAIADAMLDSVPLVAITGQVPLAMIGKDAFQEVNALDMTASITKKNFLVRSARDLLEIIPEAFEIAEHGRPGPVLVDVPKDVQIEEIVLNQWPESRGKAVEGIPSHEKILQIAEKINNSKQPLIYAGGGIINACASDVLRALAYKSSIPVALTLMGLGALRSDDSLNIGMLGMHGKISTNHILDKVDLLLAFGTRFDDRATGKVKEFCPEASVLHIDIDSRQIDKIRKSCLSLRGDVKTAIESLLPHIRENKRTEWLSEIDKNRKKDIISPISDSDYCSPPCLIKIIGQEAPADAIITTDVGQHQMWVAQYYPFNRPGTFMTSGGLGTMGFGLPASIGAALANPDKKIICISGDGSFQMNIQELATLYELDSDIKVFIMNNQHLGLVRQQQDLFFNKNFIASKFDSRIDFAAIARDYGIRGINFVEGKSGFETIHDIINTPGPCIVDVPVECEEYVFPIVPPGAANREMISREESLREMR